MDELLLKNYELLSHIKNEYDKLFIIITKKMFK